MADRNGRVEIYVANQSNVNVWFDDLEIRHKGALIAEEKNYYPFGLELAGIGKWSIPENRFTYNGQSEKQKDLNGGKGYFYETDYRGYDPQLGRFHQYEPLADFYSGISPYQYAMNNRFRGMILPDYALNVAMHKRPKPVRRKELLIINKEEALNPGVISLKEEEQQLLQQYLHPLPQNPLNLKTIPNSLQVGIAGQVMDTVLHPPCK